MLTSFGNDMDIGVRKILLACTGGVISVFVLLKKRNSILNSNKRTDSNTKIILIMALILTALLFAVWSYNPPLLGIFIPPTI